MTGTREFSAMATEAAQARAFPPMVTRGAVIAHRAALRVLDAVPSIARRLDAADLERMREAIAEEIDMASELPPPPPRRRKKAETPARA